MGERVTIESAWSDPEQSEILGRVAEGLARGGGDEDPYDLASQVLAEALLTPGGRFGGGAVVDSIAVLAAFEQRGVHLRRRGRGDPRRHRHRRRIRPVQVVDA